MIKKIISLLCAVCLITSFCCITTIPSISAKELGTSRYLPYEWKPVTIGTGGITADYLFHPKVEDLVIVRGDCGGAWIRNPDEERFRSMANFSWDQPAHFGCDGIAWDPNDPDIIYWAGGQYRWTPYNGVVLKSTDRGKTWKETSFSKRAFGSDNGEKSGNTIMVDPANSNIIYVGSYDGIGLWRSKNAGETWEQVKSLPITGTSSYMRFFAFDPTSVQEGMTKRIYVFVGNQGMYVTEDGGETWILMENYPGEASYGLSISNDGTLVSADRKGIFKYTDGEWIAISDIPDASYRGIAISPYDSDFIVAVRSSHCNIIRRPILVSQDGGKSWFNAAQEENINRIEDIGYLDDEDNFSASTWFVRMDPHNPKHVVFGDWHSVWETQDITARPKVTWQGDNLGIEELCPLNLVSHENNPYRLLVTVMDQDGFPIEELDALQSRKFTDLNKVYGGQRMSSVTGFDVCYDNPYFVVRTGSSHDMNQDRNANYSEDGGKTWKVFETNPHLGHNSTNGGNVKFSSNINQETGKPAHIVVTRSNSTAVVSHDFGATWKEIKELPTLIWGYRSAKQNLEKDCSLDDTFYFYDWLNAHFYRSTDGGDTWKKVYELGSVPSRDGFPRLVSIPNSPGEVWFATGASQAHKLAGNLYRTTDGFETIEPVPGFTSVLTVGYGKAAPGREKLTIYVVGKRDDIMGVYRSIDSGKTWDLITDENLPGGFWKDTRFVCGDMRDFGVVYVAGVGTGVFYGKPEGTELTTLSDNSEETKKITELYLSVNGNVTKCNDVIQEDGVLYYPARALYEQLKSKVFWNNENGTVEIQREIYDVHIYANSACGDIEKQELVFTPGSNIIKINGENISLNNKIIDINDRVYVPLNEVLALWNLDVNNSEDAFYQITDKNILVH